MAQTEKKGCFRRFVTTIVSLLVAVLVVVVAANLYSVLSTKGSIVDRQTAAASHADAIVVLGASVYPDGTPSPVLCDRLDGAIDLYFAGAAPVIIMSGDNRDDAYNECWAMKNYAINQGVPSEDIFCDHAGYCTYDTIFRAQQVFGCKSIIVCTQRYHQFRALCTAHMLGIDAIGYATDPRSYERIRYYELRETMGRVKDLALALVHSPSEVVSRPVSLSESGDVTNVRW